MTKYTCFSIGIYGNNNTSRYTCINVCVCVCCIRFVLDAFVSRGRLIPSAVARHLGPSAADVVSANGLTRTERERTRVNYQFV